MKEGKKFTTITTDAGIKGNISAFAYWIKTDGYQMRKSRPFKSFIASSNKAELAVIVIALNEVANHEVFRNSDIIVVNSDNKAALQQLRDKKLTDWGSEYNSVFQKALSKITAPIFFRHVKGHRPSWGNRNWVNEWCDKQIRKHYK